MTVSFKSGPLRILGTGCALPGLPVTSAQLLQKIERNFGIAPRTGIALARRLGVETRHISRTLLKRLEGPMNGARNPDLCTRALAQALLAANINSTTLQYLIGHTATPARLIPPNISEVATRIEFKGPYAELRQACTGFANALQWAAAMLTKSDAAPVALVGSEVGSVYFDPMTLLNEPEQWVNLMQMGDGAGAIVLGADDATFGARLESAFYGHLDAGLSPGFCLNEGGSDHPATKENQRSLNFSHDYVAVKAHGGALFRAGIEAITAAGYSLNDFQIIVPHQVNGHIGAWLARELDMPVERFFVNAQHVGNLGSAAIWVALHQLRHSGRLKPGERALILGAEATHYMYGGFVYLHAEPE